jgi:hypothetical protein
MKTYKLLIILVFPLVIACNSGRKNEIKTKDFSLIELNLLTNYSSDVLFMDYEGAMDGFVVPSANQTSNGKFDFDFTIKNDSKNSKKLYYKIYYQNESYKFPDNDETNESKQNEFAHENFYGSWEETECGFKYCGDLAPNEEKKITDNFRIVGNPRNEQKFYFEGENDRWKRNPRVGDYNVMIVIVDDIGLEKIPQSVKDISLAENGIFVSPFFYFLHGDGKSLDNCIVSNTKKAINLKASPDLGNGIYINESLFKSRKEPNFTDFMNCQCDKDENLFENATVSQFVHYIDESSKFNNIPVIMDFFDGTFTQEEYNWLRAFYKPEDRITVLPQTALQPCATVISDSIDNKIVLKNPKSEYGEWQKQNVGVITRHGFAYGKFTVKAKLTEILNDDFVWNGITNAIWLIYQGGRGQDETGWNLRRPCKKKGYMKTYWGGRFDDRVEQVAYSEIDFEILKTVPYCPSEKFPPVYDNYDARSNKVKAWNTQMPDDVNKDKKNIAVCCTNWDMACWEPKNFSAGCQTLTHNGKTYQAHRWEDCYRAITTKYMAPDDDLFGSEYYYFQIDWQPDKIIWRIGPEKNKLYEVGYIDNTISAIPDNQMLLIITQEFHNTNWWPGSPYQQENIPFPGKDYVGEVYEITIE